MTRRALDVRVLNRFSRVYEVERDAVFVSPLVEDTASELRPMVAHDPLGITTLQHGVKLPGAR